MNQIDEGFCIRQFLEGHPGNYIDGIVVRVVKFTGWGAAFDPQDIIQSTRLVLLKNFQNGNYRGEGLTAYVRRITEVQCLQEIRKHSRKKKYEDAGSDPVMEKPDPAPSSLDSMVYQEKRNLGVKVLKALDRRCRQLIIFKFYKNLPYLEIGLRFKMTEVNARVSVHRCLDKTKELLKKMSESL